MNLTNIILCWPKFNYSTFILILSKKKSAYCRLRINLNKITQILCIQTIVCHSSTNLNIKKKPSTLQYDDHEEVVLWMNTVGPYHNRQETYAYFSLPFCVGTKQSINHYHETLSEALQGVELEFSGYEIDFKGTQSPASQNRKCHTNQT